MRRAALLAVGLLLAGCGLSPEDAPRPLDVRAAPQASPFTRPATPVPGSRSLTLYLVRDAVLAPVGRRTTTAGTVRSAVELLLRGPTEGEAAQGLTSALAPDAVLLEDLEVQGEQVVVPLRALPDEGIVRSDEVLSYAQVVATLTALPDVRSVVFTRDGEPLPVPRADGSLADAPLTRRDYAQLL